ncbi:MAG: sulfite exporter TauE/SafE family protein [Armatimonadota bacterium]|nr:sulfite exporter TauE/SafE family protein [Armatimonadota bacterium]MDR7404791.1 sulfite exporter TauE/SafE family protein [Armatimonadota bacterium]
MDGALAPNGAFALVMLVVAFASAVKGALGFGFPLIAVPLAANLIGARTAVVLIAVAVVFSNFLILSRGGGRREDLPRFGGLLVGVVAGTVVGAQFLRRLDPQVLSVLVGVTAVALGGAGLVDRSPAVPARAERLVGPAVGLAAGVMGGITGIFAPLIAAYVQSLPVDKRGFVFWLTLSFFVGGLTQVVSYWRLGLYTPRLLAYAVVTFLPVVVGTRAGFWIQDRLPGPLFRRLVLFLVLLSGVNLIVRGL